MALMALCVQAQDRGMAERKVALVIGNSSYKSVPLKNPQNDARDVAAALRKLGFEVIERQNLGREGFAMAVREYGDKLRGATVGLFYFAGHGIQVKGRNFLVPVDADIAREDEVQYRSFDVNEVLDKMDSARTAINLVVLDACRNNPFARSFKLAQTGLAQMDAPTGTLIAFATAPGSVAQDGDGNNGLYTSALLKHIASAGLSVEQMFKRVRVDVVNQSKNQQVPWESSSLNREFAFAAPVAAPQAAVALSPAAISATELGLDLAFWDAVKDSKEAADYRAYLEQYPQGRFAALARVRGAALQPNLASVASNQPALSIPVSRPVQALSSVNAPSLQAISPEGLYKVTLTDQGLQWMDSVRGAVLRRDALADAGAVKALQFSPDGRWLLLGLDKNGHMGQQLRDAATGDVLWEKLAVSAQFDTLAPVLRLQSLAGVIETVRLP